MHVLSEHLNAASESGTEWIVRFRLAFAGVAARIQAVFCERCRLGGQAHAQETAPTNDRGRAATTMRNGKVVLQLSSAMVVDDRDFVPGSVLDVLRQRAPVR